MKIILNTYFNHNNVTFYTYFSLLYIPLQSYYKKVKCGKI